MEKEKELHLANTEEIENMIRSGQSSDFLEVLRDTGDKEPVHLYMKRVLKERNMTAAQIVKACDCERSYVYQMLNGKRKATRKFLLCFGLTVGLTAEEEQKLLRLAEKSPLYVRRRYDAVIFYALEHGMSLQETNELLYELGEDSL